MLKPWTPARARGTSTAQQELDASGEKMRALGVLGCGHPAGEAPGPAGGGRDSGRWGSQKEGTPLSSTSRTTLVPGSRWGAETWPSLGHQHSRPDTGHPRSARVRGSSSDPLV